MEGLWLKRWRIACAWVCVLVYLCLAGRFHSDASWKKRVTFAHKSQSFGSENVPSHFFCPTMNSLLNTLILNTPTFAKVSDLLRLRYIHEQQQRGVIAFGPKNWGEVKFLLASHLSKVAIFSDLASSCRAARWNCCRKCALLTPRQQLDLFFL